MDFLRQAFLSLPDTVIITDVYWYVLDYNRNTLFPGLKQGDKLTRYMKDCTHTLSDEYALLGNIYQRTVTPVFDHDTHVGYTVYLADITERKRLIAQRQKKSAELKALIRRQAKANAQLEAFVRQAEILSNYSEQFRIARSIHDGAGHAITALHTISQMCLRLRHTDLTQYHSLLEEGIALCRRTTQHEEEPHYTSLRALLESFQQSSQFPIQLSVHGAEPGFVSPLYETVYLICKEAYHNTLAHSLAETLMIDAELTPTAFTLRVFDDGRFHGAFEKGFGLTAMEDSVLASGGTLSFCAEEGTGFGITAEWRSDLCTNE
jgi:signal transduction histidine kinase